MTATALVGLLEPVADVVGGSARLTGQDEEVDLLSAPKKRGCELAGTELAIVFQDALTALNPLYTVGTQLAEPFRIHHGMSAKEAKRKAWPALDTVAAGRKAACHFPEEVTNV